MPDPDYLFFDIETTGLSPANSHVTVIGTAFEGENGPVVRQFVCERPNEERNILLAFSAFARGFSGLAHFNGSSFDLPYLRKKFAFYRIEDPLRGLDQTDLYQVGKRFASFLQLDSAKQKDFEKAFSFPRTDTISGRECVRCYRAFLLTGERTELEKILLHNREDLLGMMHIRSHLDAFVSLAEGRFEITDERAANDRLVLEIKTEKPFSQPFRFSSRSLRSPSDPVLYEILIDRDLGTFTLFGEQKDLKLYFENYKDYYYLPAEGRAIHRSVGQFVDAAHREKATRQTAFEPVSAVFFPQLAHAVTPACKQEPDDKISWFRAADIRSAEELKGVILALF